MGHLALASFIARLGPYLGRLMQSRPQFLAALTTKLRLSGATVGNSVASILTWVKKNPANAVLIASTLASLGYSASELISAEDDDETKAFISGLDRIAAEAASKINTTGSASEMLRLGAASTTEQANIMASREVLKYAMGFFGSQTAAKMAHKYLQAFMEMPKADVDFGFSNLRLDEVTLSLR